MTEQEKIIAKASEGLAQASSQKILSIEVITAIASDKQLLQKYENTYPDKLYSLILYSLSHESVNEDEARGLWKLINFHWKSLNNVLQRDVGIAVAALDYLSNIHNVLSSPILMEEEKSNSISEIATKDMLTGLVTREVFFVVLDKELQQLDRSDETVSLAMLDIDDFKQVNDTHGHQQGDSVLTAVGRSILNNIRDMDTAARYGGEELVILMPRTEIDTAYLVVERIRKDIETLSIDGIKVTISIGLASSSRSKQSVEALLRQADEALYAAKKQGKNRVLKSTL